jgi:hypothetical protein
MQETAKHEKNARRRLGSKDNLFQNEIVKIKLNTTSLMGSSIEGIVNAKLFDGTIGMLDFNIVEFGGFVVAGMAGNVCICPLRKNGSRFCLQPFLFEK